MRRYLRDISPEARMVTLLQAGEFYRAMNGDLEAQKAVAIQDVAGLENAPTFERFLLWNKDRLVIYEHEELRC